ncbi:MAG: NAD(+) synthase [Oscillospiraceae bacterium]|nr:NAD(+) synthase [Oscillospiraceae bacterium]
MKDSIVAWIRHFMGEDTTAVLGISGGKDSTVAAALCVEALGSERVVGVLMPQGVQPDIDVSYGVCEFLGIRFLEIDIGETVQTLFDAVQIEMCEVATRNTPARIRMTALYAVAACANENGGGRVVNTCNLSESYVGWETKYGDAAGDFAPLGDLTVSEIKAVGYELGLPSAFIEKTPIDGLCGKTDEEALGFTYAELDKYIREGSSGSQSVDERIAELHRLSEHKRAVMPMYKTGRAED